MFLQKLLSNVNWKLLHGVALLCGVVFTMSLFIGSLVFEQRSNSVAFQDRLGVVIGFLSQVL